MRRSRGFTLLQLLIGIVLVVILVTAFMCLASNTPSSGGLYTGTYNTVSGDVSVSSNVQPSGNSWWHGIGSSSPSHTTSSTSDSGGWNWGGSSDSGSWSGGGSSYDSGGWSGGSSYSASDTGGWSSSSSGSSDSGGW